MFKEIFPHILTSYKEHEMYGFIAEKLKMIATYQ